jgi:hypothetical protein
VCANEDAATLFGVLARHDPEALKRCATVRQQQEILSEEDEKIQKNASAGCVLRDFVRSWDVSAPFLATLNMF